MSTTAPAGLGRAGKALWKGIAGVYELRADELRVLEDAASEADLVEQLKDGMVDQPLIVRGSQGQEVINPLVSELRQHRATLSALLRQLKLPDEGQSEAAISNQARAAANTRWARRGA